MILDKIKIRISQIQNKDIICSTDIVRILYTIKNSSFFMDNIEGYDRIINKLNSIHKIINPIHLKHFKIGLKPLKLDLFKTIVCLTNEIKTEDIVKQNVLDELHARVRSNKRQVEDIRDISNDCIYHLNRVSHKEMTPFMIDPNFKSYYNNVTGKPLEFGEFELTRKNLIQHHESIKICCNELIDNYFVNINPIGILPYLWDILNDHLQIKKSQL